MINADGHDVMGNFHKPYDEKRSIVVLKDSDYSGWLNADPEAFRFAETNAKEGDNWNEASYQARLNLIYH